MKLELVFEGGTCVFELEESFEVVKKLTEKIPFESRANTWGEEIYFSISIDVTTMENPRETVEVGDVGYWPPGKALCFFFGKTPISDDKIRPASTVNVIGRIVQGMENLKKIKDGDKITVKFASA
ncbi:cyclophilin-like fold protein [Thermotoga sp. KOL6]|uniref:cyclophilin-like fold protein n=1 Tax=Thermotoga sp. KOL6 TaxID=126741 RepID=UPI000C755F62|nr:cyclophilin-like fold protein [Thermotoga sp. KOL6]PLV60486.1 hypothetical protein AS005_01635 [Thermotoga sp. KOL6]